jgi:hypothetical protein
MYNVLMYAVCSCSASLYSSLHFFIGRNLYLVPIAYSFQAINVCHKYRGNFGKADNLISLPPEEELLQQAYVSGDASIITKNSSL